MNCRQSESITEKAERLRANSRVIVIRNELAIVIGDHDTHKVTKQGPKWSCDCKWGQYRGAWREHAHIVAAKQARKDLLGQAVVARLADWLMEADVG